jgi:hypothetical protein
MCMNLVALLTAARKCRLRQLTVGFATAVLCGGLLTQAAVADATTWGGLGWGLGIAVDFDTSGNRVVSATNVNGIVRVNDTSSNTNISFVLEAHYFLRDYFFTSGGTLPTCPPQGDPYCMEVAHGPFVAIEVGGGTSATPANNGPITAYALGWMVGLRHPLLTTSKTSSWNFGVGFRIDPRAQVLGDGLVANAPLPPGDAIRYKTEPRYGVMIMSSFSF